MWEPSLLPPLRRHTAALYRQQDGEPAAFINRRWQEGATKRKGPPVAEISRSCQRKGSSGPAGGRAGRVSALQSRRPLIFALFHLVGMRAVLVDP